MVAHEVERGNGVTIGIENRFSLPICVTLDCTKSENVRSHVGQLVVELTVPSHGCLVAQVLRFLCMQCTYLAQVL